MIATDDTTSIAIFEKLATVGAGEPIESCTAAYAELLAANCCLLEPTPEAAREHFRRLQIEIDQTIVERFDHYRNQAAEYVPETTQIGLFDQNGSAAPELPPEIESPVDHDRPLTGWPRARAMRDVADFLMACRDSDGQIAVGCIYPWMRDLIVEVLRAELAMLTQATGAAWTARLQADAP